MREHTYHIDGEIELSANKTVFEKIYISSWAFNFCCLNLPKTGRIFSIISTILLHENKKQQIGNDIECGSEKRGGSRNAKMCLYIRSIKDSCCLPLLSPCSFQWFCFKKWVVLRVISNRHSLDSVLSLSSAYAAVSITLPSCSDTLYSTVVNSLLCSTTQPTNGWKNEGRRGADILGRSVRRGSTAK